MTLALPIAPPRPSVIPTGDDVHVWTVRHGTAGWRDDARCAAVLSDTEMARFNRFTNVRQRVRRIHARGAGVHGKPSVAGVEFNWVIKEACLKAMGTGLAADPRELCVSRASQTVFDVTRGADALRARSLAIPGGHVAAVAGRTLANAVVHDEAEF